MAGVGERLDEVGPDKPGTAGHKDSHTPRLRMVAPASGAEQRVLLSL